MRISWKCLFLFILAPSFVISCLSLFRSFIVCYLILLHSYFVLSLAYPPEMQHVEQNRDLHEVEPSADVVVPQHEQALAQLQRRPIQKVGLPVAAQDLLEGGGVDFKRILVDQFAQ
jgi:hypothetical protein